MTYLLDVNALLAIHFAKHVHHPRVSRWLEDRAQTERDNLLLATCAITELGFVRVATAFGATLATLDKGIAGALLIPELRDEANHVGEPRLTYGAAA